jgi:hypothetical protein
MTTSVSDDELDAIERRAMKALAAAPLPWQEFLETTHGIGGSSFVRLGQDDDVDREMHLSIHVDGDTWHSPDPRLDAIIDFVAHAAEDVPRLVAEIRNLRSI